MRLLVKKLTRRRFLEDTAGLLLKAGLPSIKRPKRSGSPAWTSRPTDG